MTTLPNFKAEEFDAKARQEQDALVLELSGTADLRIQQQLDEFLESAHSHAQKLSVREVVVDLRKLEFMNSSCFKAFVSWIGDLQQLEPASQYKIRFLSEPRMLWQRRSLHALSCFAVDLISIETG
jgi:anti-anti-sigma factor